MSMTRPVSLNLFSRHDSSSLSVFYDCTHHYKNVGPIGDKTINCKWVRGCTLAGSLCTQNLSSSSLKIVLLDKSYENEKVNKLGEYYYKQSAQEMCCLCRLKQSVITVSLTPRFIK